MENEIEKSLDHLLRIMMGKTNLKVSIDGYIMPSPYVITEEGNPYYLHINKVIEETKLNHQYLKELMGILADDKYVIVEYTDTVLKKLLKCEITLKGKMFILKDGYVQQLKDASSERTFQTLALWISAIGTGLAGIYVLWEMLKAVLRFFYCG